jgi:hypothetical protein
MQYEILISIMNKFEKFHKEHPEVSLFWIAIESGINASLVRQYAVGIKNPGKNQLAKLQAGIHEIGKSLLNIQIS